MRRRFTGLAAAPHLFVYVVESEKGKMIACVRRNFKEGPLAHITASAEVKTSDFHRVLREELLRKASRLPTSTNVDYAQATFQLPDKTLVPSDSSQQFLTFFKAHSEAARPFQPGLSLKRPAANIVT